MKNSTIYTKDKVFKIKRMGKCTMGLLFCFMNVLLFWYVYNMYFLEVNIVPFVN